MIIIYHARVPMFGFGPAMPFNTDNFVKVAEVATEQLDKAFMLTNTIDHPWVENTEVKLEEGITKARSTSVGDVLEKDGRRWRVCMVGFEEVKG